MKTLIKTIITLSILTIALVSTAQGQWGGGDPFDAMLQDLQAQDAQWNAYLINLYRTSTGDYSSPDQIAWNQGFALHCQQNPADCGAASNVAAQGNPVGDIIMQGWNERNAAQEKGHANYVNGAIWEQSSYTNTSTGASFNLPDSAQINTLYSTPSGVNVMYDGTTWYQVDQYGYGTPLQSY